MVISRLDMLEIVLSVEQKYALLIVDRKVVLLICVRYLSTQSHLGCQDCQ